MKTFNELLASATRGPVNFIGPDSDGDCDIVGKRLVACLVGRTDAELITRLLNFAHNGGINTLLKWQEARAKADAARDSDCLADAIIAEILLERDLTRALDTLNGESPK